MGNKISVIIPTLNEEKYIGNILSDLTHQIYPNFEIIVVDGHSTDTTNTVIKKYKDVTLFHTKANVAHQRNTGAHKATGDLLIFLDADVRIKPNFLSNISNEFSNQTLSVACPIYFPIENHLSSIFLYTFFNCIFFVVQKLKPSGAGSCIVVTKKAYYKIGGFDERFTYDDMHFISRSKKACNFKILKQIIHVSNRRIKKLGFMQSLLLYTKLSWYFMRNDYEKANEIKYPFSIY